MGVEHNQLGEEWDSRKASHKRGNPYGLGQQSGTISFCVREKEREPGDGATMEGELWSITRANWSWKTEEPCF
jgi:hypothetical protein